MQGLEQNCDILQAMCIEVTHCFVLLCLGNGKFYLYPSGLFYRDWDNLSASEVTQKCMGKKEKY